MGESREEPSEAKRVCQRRKQQGGHLEMYLHLPSGASVTSMSELRRNWSIAASTSHFSFTALSMTASRASCGMIERQLLSIKKTCFAAGEREVKVGSKRDSSKCERSETILSMRTARCALLTSPKRILMTYGCPSDSRIRSLRYSSLKR